MNALIQAHAAGRQGLCLSFSDSLTNRLERLNQEIKRRTCVATLFPNEASLLRLASAVLSEISDDWEAERGYLNTEAR